MLAARITGNESPGGTRHLKLFVCADFICLPNQQAFFTALKEAQMASFAFLAVWLVVILSGLINLLRTLLNIWCGPEQH